MLDSKEHAEMVQKLKGLELAEYEEELKGETFTDLVLVGGPDMREIENPPIWRQHNFSDRANFRRTGSSFCRNHSRRARANLWSGQRKRQVVDG